MGSKRRWSRYLAPLALLACTVAVVAVVSSGGHSDNGSRSTATRAHRPHHRFYYVRSGDDLSRIAIRTGVAVTRLEQLNKNVDPNSLIPGERLKLRP